MTTLYALFSNCAFVGSIVCIKNPGTLTFLGPIGCSLISLMASSRHCIIALECRSTCACYSLRSQVSPRLYTANIKAAFARVSIKIAAMLHVLMRLSVRQTYSCTELTDGIKFFCCAVLLFSLAQQAFRCTKTVLSLIKPRDACVISIRIV